MNINKVWFYIALMGILILGVWASLPGEDERQKIRAAAERKKQQGKKETPIPAAASSAASAASR